MINQYRQENNYRNKKMNSNCKKTIEMKKLREVNNTRDMVFQIWPKLNYEIHRDYYKLKKEKKSFEGNI